MKTSFAFHIKGELMYILTVERHSYRNNRLFHSYRKFLQKQPAVSQLQEIPAETTGCFTVTGHSYRNDRLFNSRRIFLQKRPAVSQSDIPTRITASFTIKGHSYRNRNSLLFHYRKQLIVSYLGNADGPLVERRTRDQKISG